LIVNKAGTISYFNADGLGSVTGTNSPAGTYDYRSVFDAWGSVRSETGTRTSSFTYTGRETGEGGLHFYRARYYQPSVGRFTQEDPINRNTYETRLGAVAKPLGGVLTIGESSIPPLIPPHFADYAYVGNYPLLMTDPTGEDARDWYNAFQGYNLIKYFKCTWQHIGCTNGVDRSCRCRDYSSPYGVYNCMYNGYICCDRKFLICRWGLAYRVGKATGIIDPTPPPDNCAGAS
jgi:RHS repeat-associated protein